MKVTKAYRYRLRPRSKADAQYLQSLCDLDRWLWNQLVELYQWPEEILRGAELGEYNKAEDKRVRKVVKERLKERPALYNLVCSLRNFEFITQNFNRARLDYYKAVKAGKVAQIKAKQRQHDKQVLAAQLAQGVPPPLRIKTSKEKYDRIGRPQFKKWRRHNSFSYDTKYTPAEIDLHHGSVSLKDRVGIVRTIPFLICRKDRIYTDAELTINRFTITQKAGAFYIAINITSEQNDPAIPEIGEEDVVGLDLGCRYTVVTSTGRRYRQRDTERIDKQIKAIQRKMSAAWEANHKRPDWKRKNYNKMAAKVAKLQAQKAHIRKEDTHQITNAILDQADCVAYENLTVKDLMARPAVKIAADGKTFVPNGATRQSRINRVFAHRNLHEIRTQLAYKAKWRGKIAVELDKGKPSNRSCAECGVDSQVTQYRREWTCPACGHIHDRNENSSEVIRQMGIKKLKLA